MPEAAVLEQTPSDPDFKGWILIRLPIVEGPMEPRQRPYACIEMIEGEGMRLAVTDGSERGAIRIGFRDAACAVREPRQS